MLFLIIASPEEIGAHTGHLFRDEFEGHLTKVKFPTKQLFKFLYILLILLSYQYFAGDKPPNPSPFGLQAAGIKNCSLFTCHFLGDFIHI